MDRMTWLKEMRRVCEEQYDWRWGLYSNRSHLQFLQAFINLLPSNGKVLDAACGAGRYIPTLLEQGHTVLGIDQSLGMLVRAQEGFPEVLFEKIGLQEMAFESVFDGAICMDAMENVPPEDWPVVLGNFNRALKAGGYLYFTSETIENADEGEIRQAFEKAQAAGLPVVYGEWPDEHVYHFHPTNQRAMGWVEGAGFEILKVGDGDGYHHMLVRKG